jgi:antitoxin HigA-1
MSKQVCLQEGRARSTSLRHHPHPGEVLVGRILVPLRLGLLKASRRIGVRPAVLKGMITGKLPLTNGLARMLARAFDVKASTWLSLQRAYNLERRGHHVPKVRFRRPTSFYAERARMMGIESQDELVAFD